MIYPTKFKYEVHTHEHVPTTGGVFDVNDWLNELGQGGWEVVEIQQRIVDSGLMTAANEKIPKLVIDVLAKKAIFDEAVPEAA